MRRALLAAALALAAPGAARAAGSGCQDTSGSFVLEKIRPNATGPQFVGCVNRTFDLLASSVATLSTASAATFQWLNVHRISGLSTGTLVDIRVSSGIRFDANTYALFLGSVTMSSAAGASVTYGFSAGSATIGNFGRVNAYLFVAGTAAVAGNFSAGTSTTFAVADGRVGVGISTPSGPLHVNGVALADSLQVVGGSVTLPNGSSARPSIFWRDVAGGGAGCYGTGSEVVCEAGGADVFRINSGGLHGNAGSGVDWNLPNNPSIGNPMYTSMGDDDTGVHLPGGGVVEIGADGARRVNVNADGAGFLVPVTAASSVTVSASAFSVGASTFAVAGGQVGVRISSPAAGAALEVNGQALAQYLVVRSSGSAKTFAVGAGQTGSAALEVTGDAYFDGGNYAFGQASVPGSTRLLVKGGGTGSGTSGLEVYNASNQLGLRVRDDRRIHVYDGTAALPGLGFIDEVQTGFARTASNTIKAVYGGGTAAGTFSSAGLSGGDGDNDAKATLDRSPSGCSQPSLHGATDTNTGVNLASDQVQLCANGADRVKAGDSVAVTVPLVAKSSLTVEGDAASVGISTLAVTGGQVGVGTASPGTKLHLSSGVLTVDGSGGGLNVNRDTFTVAGSSAGVRQASPQGALHVSSGIFVNDGAGAKVRTTGVFAVGQKDGTSGVCSGGQALSATWDGGIITGGSCVSSGAGDAVLAATQTWSGYNDFRGAVQVSSSLRVSTGAALEMNLPSASMLNASGVSIWARSFDGAAQSSGCLVAVYMDTNTVSAMANFTSTTTSLNLATADVSGGVLLERCDPLSYCRVGVHGFYRVQTNDPGNTSFVNNMPKFSTTRCQATGTTTDGSANVGFFVNTTSDASGFIWVKLVH